MQGKEGGRALNLEKRYGKKKKNGLYRDLYCYYIHIAAKVRKELTREVI